MQIPTNVELQKRVHPITIIFAISGWFIENEKQGGFKEAYGI